MTTECWPRCAEVLMKQIPKVLGVAVFISREPEDAVSREPSVSAVCVHRTVFYVRRVPSSLGEL